MVRCKIEDNTTDNKRKVELTMEGTTTHLMQEVAILISHLVYDAPEQLREDIILTILTLSLKFAEDRNKNKTGQTIDLSKLGEFLKGNPND